MEPGPFQIQSLERSRLEAGTGVEPPHEKSPGLGSGAPVVMKVGSDHQYFVVTLMPPVEAPDERSRNRLHLLQCMQDAAQTGVAGWQSRGEIELRQIVPLVGRVAIFATHEQAVDGQPSERVFKAAADEPALVGMG